MTKKLSYGVFGWNVAKLCEAVNALEAEGHHVRGYEITKFGGYGYVEHDRLVFLEYAPDVLDGWKAKAKEVGFTVTGEIDMPPVPRAYGDAVTIDLGETKEVRVQTNTPVREEKPEDPAPAASETTDAEDIDALRAEATALGVNVDRRWSVQTLLEKLADARG